MSDDFDTAAKELGYAVVPHAGGVQAILKVIGRAFGQPDLDAAIRESDDGFMLDIAKQLEDMLAKVDEKVSADQVYDLVVHMVEYARWNPSAEKRELLRNTLINSLRPEFAGDPVGRLVLRTTAELDPLHVRLLALLATLTYVVTPGEAEPGRYLFDPPDGVNPEEFRRELQEVGAYLPKPVETFRWIGTFISSPADPNSVAAFLRVESDVANKLLKDLEALGCVSPETDGEDVYYRLNGFGLRVLLMIAAPDRAWWPQ
ncbi:hypothetical protein ACFL6C_07710 [Myxococcota bacterium]